MHLDTDGNLLIDARDTWTTYKVSLHTGKFIWRLGGKPEAAGRDTCTFFDNESSGAPELPCSRAITVRLNERARTATLVASDNQPEG